MPAETSFVVQISMNLEAVDILRKRCSEKMQQVYSRTHMPKSDFNKVALQLYWNHTSAWVFFCKFAAYFQNTVPKNTSGRLLLMNFKRWPKALVPGCNISAKIAYVGSITLVSVS